MKIINLERKPYNSMLREIKYLMNPTQDKLGEIVCVRYRYTADEYLNKVQNTRVRIDLTEKQKEKLINYYPEIKEYEQSLRQNIITYKTIINSFVQGNYLTIHDFCEKENICVKDFEFSIKAISFLEPELYISTMDIINKREETFKKYCQNISITMNKLIQNGINDSNKIREFDLIDYYSLINITPNELIYQVRYALPFEEIGEIKKFSHKYNYDQKLTYEHMQRKFYDRIEYECKFDSNNKPVKGTGRLITEEEKIKVFEYLISNKLPITEGTYLAGLTRIKNNTIDFITQKTDQNKKCLLIK